MTEMQWTSSSAPCGTSSPTRAIGGENALERYQRSGACGNDAELLAARRERLQNEWAMYPLTLANYGLYTTVVE